MTRQSAFRGTWTPNRRPYLTLTPDAYVAIQGQTSVIGCGECLREVNVNRYLVSLNTEANVDSPPGSASFTLSIPDTDVNDFYVNGQFLIVPMMEIEMFAKGYFTVGGVPQYYKIFWGLVSSVTQNWSNGVTTITVNCRDILRWWELTTVTLNPAFLDSVGSSAGNFQLWGNQFAGDNPYTVIASLAKDSVGDFSHTTGSFIQYRPELGPEQQVIGEYMKDVMAYWQLKFGSFWNNLVLYGSSGQAYTFTNTDKNVSTLQVVKSIFEEEVQLRRLNPQTEAFQVRSGEVATFKKSLPKAGDVEFMQAEQRSKLSLALDSRDQAGNFEFYCDTTGDIIFKPPFYNLNVIPNKPTSWIQDFEIIDDSVTDSEAEVFTHITSSGNAFGGKMDWGLNDEITTPRTAVYDYHLLRRYGWRRYDYQVEWAGNPRKLFFHLFDVLDRQNSKRQYGTVTIPLRPELRMGFPVWIPKYDSFFYVQGISHNFTVGGQATTVLTLTAKRSKFIAPKNIGGISKTGQRRVPGKGNLVTKTVKVAGQKKEVYEQNSSGETEPTYTVNFPSQAGKTIGLNEVTTDRSIDGPATLRHPKTGELMGFPNVVMTYRTTLDGEKLASIMAKTGQSEHDKPKEKNRKNVEGSDYKYKKVEAEVRELLQQSKKSELIARMRSHRYEAAMTNLGAYDYAHDKSSTFNEISVIPVQSITYGEGTKEPRLISNQTVKEQKDRNDQLKKERLELENHIDDLRKQLREAQNSFKASLKEKRTKVGKDVDSSNDGVKNEVRSLNNSLSDSNKELDKLNKKLKKLKNQEDNIESQLKTLGLSDDEIESIITYPTDYDADSNLSLPVELVEGSASLNRINKLHESIQQLAKTLILKASEVGIPLVISNGLRTNEEQQRLYDQGRSAPGPKVTGAKPGTSWHNYGLAFDVAVMKNGKPTWPNDVGLWNQIGDIGRSIGLRWGGDFGDLPHFEYHPGLTINDAVYGARPDVPDTEEPGEIPEVVV
jgi:peptidoglycan L-alanyl-D-glutamate endopeptidase CwlK